MSSTTETSTVETSSLRLKGVSGPSKQLPDRVKERIDALPKLSREQAGHIRHFHNLASQLDGDWSFFGTQEPGQEWLDAIRYQLATMAYAAAAAHFHRLPALRSPMRELFQKLIRKMLRREVWSYWYLTSQSGIRVNPDLKEMRKPWADPVRRENIMYSGHLLLMVSMYGMLFDSNEYEQEGSIVFNWDPIFWGFGPEKFEYSRQSIQDVIIKEMEKNGWVGVCCEPNLVFVVCNQFPITAMRYADVRNGTRIADDVLTKYKAALARKGMIKDEGEFAEMWQVQQDRTIPAPDICFTAWAATFMNGWNSKQVRALYPSQALGALTKSEDGRVNVERADVAALIRKKVISESADPDSIATREEAVKEANENPPERRMPYTKPTFGCVAEWISEVGPPGMLDGIIKHAETYLNPSWNKGGLYYPRNDQPEDAKGNWTMMDPVTGNGAIGYARLNVSDGQKIMWENAWSTVRDKVAIENVGFGEDVDFLRCEWQSSGDSLNGLVMTMRTWNGQKQMIRPKIVSLPSGTYDVFINGLWTKSYTEGSGEDLYIDIEVSGDEIDVCVLLK